jgi:serine/threonine-protein kinase
MFAGKTLFQTGVVWTYYIAVEPFLRRRWPQVLMSWTRLLSGKFRDPLVGRDILIGCAAGIAFRCGLLLQGWLTALLARVQLAGATVSGGPDAQAGLNAVIDVRMYLSRFFAWPGAAIELAFYFILVVFCIRIVLRRDWTAIVVPAVLFTLNNNMAIQNPWLVGPVVLANNLIMFGVPVRFGLLSFFAAFSTLAFSTTSPMIFQAGTWYTGYDYASLTVVAAFTIYGFHTALGGRRLIDLSKLADTA